MSFRQLIRCTRRYSSSAASLSQLPKLTNGNIDTFRAEAFVPATPVLLPRGHFASYPAISQWFEHSETFGLRLNTKYLQANGAVPVPLEITSSVNDAETQFIRLERPLSDFLEFVAKFEEHRAASILAQEKISPPIPNIYLAQCSLSSLPASLNADLPTPELVSGAGRGDVYDSSIWLGLAPTYTSLHKDPNPNLFVQLAGTKVVRLFEPLIGAELFAEAQKRAGALSSASFRGEEMMQGPEKEALEVLVWQSEQLSAGYEAVVQPGDGVFIPKGWWHSIKGIGEGIVGSVSSLYETGQKDMSAN